MRVRAHFNLEIKSINTVATVILVRRRGRSRGSEGGGNHVRGWSARSDQGGQYAPRSQGTVAIDRLRIAVAIICPMGTTMDPRPTLKLS